MPKDEDAAGRGADRARSAAGSTRARGRRRPRRRRRQPWEAPLTLTRPVLPRRDVGRPGTAPVDRTRRLLPAAGAARSASPRSSRDALFARRAYLDVWGLLPTPDAAAGLRRRSRARQARRAGAGRCSPIATRTPSTGCRSGTTCCATRTASATSPRPPAARASRRGCCRRCKRNLPYDEFVATLLNPRAPGDPEGFLIGVNWRGETSAAVTPWMQASQNTAQVFLGVNLKCNVCHDSFVSRWKLKDAYGLAAYFSPEPTLQLYRCDVAQDEHAEPRLPLPGAQRARRARTRSPIAAPRRPRSSPIRGTAGCRARSSTGSGSASSATASSPTRTRWTASRGARRCSTGWRATSSSTATT